jgi:hypothetical protein
VAGAISTLKNYLEQRNAITVLLALHCLPNPTWGMVRDFALMELHVQSLSDYSYRSLCKQLVGMGLAEAIKVDRMKSNYRLTKAGHEAATAIDQALRLSELWRERSRKQMGQRFPTKS